MAATFSEENFTLAQLEYSALSPWRVKALFTPPVANQRLEVFNVRTDLPSLKQAYLTAGGRVLVTICSSRALQAWHLGFTLETAPQLITSMQSCGQFVTCIAVHPAHNGTDYHVVLRDTHA